MVADIKTLVQRSSELLTDVQQLDDKRVKDGISLFDVHGISSRAATLIHSVTGPSSGYAENLRIAMKVKTTPGQFLAVAGVLQGFHLDLAKGHLINIRHEVETVVVSEILAQAKGLLRKKDVHPATAVIVACAGAEEFLRNWCEEKGITVPEKQRSITKFAQELRLAGHIEMPVERRITSWADYRNNAAHGSKWEKISRDIAERLVSEVESFLVENRKVLG